MSELDGNTLEAIAFVGDTLAPFFLQDPYSGNASASFCALKELDINLVAEEWPFVETRDAEDCLQLVAIGLSGSAVTDEGFRAEESLTWEYRRLFVGPAAKPAPPWGSVYTDRECVIFGTTTLELRSWMRSHGVARIADEKAPEDHIGLMLALMAWLAANRPEDLPEFLRLHLLTWSSHFLTELTDAAEHPFYKGLAKLTRLSLEGVQAALGIQVEYPHYYR